MFVRYWSSSETNNIQFSNCHYKLEKFLKYSMGSIIGYMSRVTPRPFQTLENVFRSIYTPITVHFAHVVFSKKLFLKKWSPKLMRFAIQFFILQVWPDCQFLVQFLGLKMLLLLTLYISDSSQIDLKLKTWRDNIFLIVFIRFEGNPNWGKLHFSILDQFDH